MYSYTTIIIFLILFSYLMLKFYKRYLSKPNFKNMTIWITGASSGIGEQFAYQFSKLQANLIISSRSKQYLERVRASCANPQKVQVVILDMTDFNQVQRVSKYIINDLQKAGQKLDIIIQNAGVSLRCHLQDIDFKNHIKIFDTNVHGPVKHIQSILPHMIKNKSGHIIGISSLSAKISTSYRSSYAGTKSALLSILDSLRIQLYPHNIKVTTIVPGFIHTNLSKNAFIQSEGQHFQKTDLNNYNGMDPAQFVKIAIKGIYRKDKQLLISQNMFQRVKIFIRNMLPSLGFLLMLRNNKNQEWAIQNAKKQEWAIPNQKQVSTKKVKVQKQQNKQETEQEQNEKEQKQKQNQNQEIQQKNQKSKKTKKQKLSKQQNQDKRKVSQAKQKQSKKVKKDEFGIQIQSKVDQNQNQQQNKNQKQKQKQKQKEKQKLKENQKQVENQNNNAKNEEKVRSKKSKQNKKQVKKDTQTIQNSKGELKMQSQNKDLKNKKVEVKSSRDENKESQKDERKILNEKNKNE